MKTSELTGAALDWCVLELENGQGAAWYVDSRGRFMEEHGDLSAVFMPSTNWAQGGPIIEREGISIRYSEKDARGAWYAVLGPNRFLSPDHEGSGPTPLIAAMRCFCRSKLGEEVDVPEELT